MNTTTTSLCKTRSGKMVIAMFLPGKGSDQMSGFLSFGPSNVQLVLFLPPSSPPGFPHELIQDLAHLSRLAGSQLVAERGQESRFTEVGREAQTRHLSALQSGSSQGQ